MFDTRSKAAKRAAFKERIFDAPSPEASKAEWIAYAAKMERINRHFWSFFIVDMAPAYADPDDAPKGGRPRLSHARVTMIEADLIGGYSMRAAAVRSGVSAMTVSRIAKRMRARAGVSQ